MKIPDQHVPGEPQKEAQPAEPATDSIGTGLASSPANYQPKPRKAKKTNPPALRDQGYAQRPSGEMRSLS